MSFEIGAALGIPDLTAHGALAAAPPQPGDIGFPATAMSRRSLAVIGFNVGNLAAEARVRTLASLVDAAASGRLRPNIAGRHRLAEAAAAHVDLGHRGRNGQLSLQP